MLYSDKRFPQNVVSRAPPDGSGGSFGTSNHRLVITGKASIVGGRQAGGVAPLGNTAKSVDQPVSAKSDEQDQKRKAQLARHCRMAAFRLQRRAAKLLPDERVGLCRWAVQSREAGVDIMLTQYEGGAIRASYAGLQTCGSVWLCPCCGRRISETRRGELNEMLAWARAEGLQPVMITLTSRHGIRDQLAGQLDAMKRAKQRLRQRREWRAIKNRIAGTVTATEVTHGAHGWHTHFHEIVLVEAEDEAEAIAVLAGLDRVWRACLLGVGLSGGRAAWLVQGAAAAGRYVGKWGAGEEMTMTGAKSARGKGRTPLHLLADADADDEHAGLLWRTYGLAFKGRRQLVWSPGLKGRVGIDDTSDAEAAQDESQDDVEDVAPLLNIEHEIWTGRTGWLGARYRRGRILSAAEIGGVTSAAETVADGRRDEEPQDCIGVIDDTVPMSEWSKNLADRKAGNLKPSPVVFVPDDPPDLPAPPPVSVFHALVDEIEGENPNPSICW